MIKKIFLTISLPALMILNASIANAQIQVVKTESVYNGVFLSVKNPSAFPNSDFICEIYQHGFLIGVGFGKFEWGQGVPTRIFIPLPTDINSQLQYKCFQ
jgi:hypothetical protein